MYEFLAKRYALALYEISDKKGKVQEYLKEFHEVTDLVIGNEEIQQILNHPKISTNRKKEIFTSIFKEKISNDLLSLLFILIEKDRIKDIVEISKQLDLIDLEKNNTVEANVKTVVPLTEDEKTKLIEKLKVKYKKNINFKEEIDETIIGGVYLRVGDDVIDGTIKNKLYEIQKLMLKDKLEVVEEKR